MADNSPRDNAALRGLALQIARMQRDLRILETSTQGAYTSVEEGSVDFYDEDGVLRERVGKQKDGSYGRLTLDGPVPPAPTEPDVQVIDNGVVAITWDGRTDEKWPTAEFRMVRVHMDDTEDFTPTRNNQVGSFHAQRGGTIVAVTESDDDNPVWVRLVAVSTAGHTSTPSDSVLVDELDEDDLEEPPEETEWEADDLYVLTAGDITAGTVTFPLTHDPEPESLIGFWNTLPQEPSEYSIDYDTSEVTWPLDGFEEEGDVLWVHYAYTRTRVPTTSVVMSGAQRNSGWSSIALGSGILTDDLIIAFSNGGVSGTGWTLHAEATGHHLSYAADAEVTGQLYSRRAVASDESGSTVITGGTGVSLLAVVVLRGAADIGDVEVLACEMATPTTQTIPAPAVAGGEERYVFSVIQGGGGQIAHLTAEGDLTSVIEADASLSGSIGVGKTINGEALAPAWSIYYEGGMSNGSDWPWVSFSVAVGGI